MLKISCSCSCGSRSLLFASLVVGLACYHRFPDRETADQSARAAGDRLYRQRAPAARPITQPRPDHRHRCPARHHRTRRHRDRRLYPRPAPGRAAQPRPARRLAAVSTPAQRLRQQRSPHVDRRTAGSPRRTGHHRPDDLRPATTPRPRPHRPHPAHSPIYHYRPRPAHRDVPLRGARPIPVDRLGAPRRPRDLANTACSFPRIPNAPRESQPHNRTRRVTSQTEPENTKLDSKIRLRRIKQS